MDKPYNLKALGKSIREEAGKDGLNVAEDALEKLGKAVYVGMKKWIMESALMSETKLDDFIVPFLSHIDPFVLPQIEKLDIDGDGK